MSVSKANLTSDELKMLKKAYRSPFMTALAFSIFIEIGLHIYIYNYDDHPNLLILEGTFIGLILIIWFLTRASTKKLRLDIRNGCKDLIAKIISDKKVIIMETQGLGPPSKRYYFWFDQLRSSVEKDLFDKANVGDTIIIHTAPKSQNIFRFEIVKS